MESANNTCSILISKYAKYGAKCRSIKLWSFRIAIFLIYQNFCYNPILFKTTCLFRSTNNNIFNNEYLLKDFQIWGMKMLIQVECLMIYCSTPDTIHRYKYLKLAWYRLSFTRVRWWLITRRLDTALWDRDRVICIFPIIPTYRT